jgi:hypothetical protein
MGIGVIVVLSLLLASHSHGFHRLLGRGMQKTAVKNIHLHGISPFLLSDADNIIASQLSSLGYTSNSLSSSDLQNIAILGAGMAYVIFDRSPQGSAKDDLLEVRPSKHIANNLGVVAKSFIPKGTSLGFYPGYVKSVERFQSTSELFIQ